VAELEEPRRREGSKRDRRWWFRENAYRDFWLVVLSGLLVWALALQHDEGLNRRDQTCVVFERLHQIDVHQLRSTYRYLQGHTDPQLKQLNAAILRNLPALEKRVRDGKPPAYCAAPGIGLDDRKFAKVPKRPPSLRLPKPSG
jgi:hypothetical protein